MDNKVFNYNGNDVTFQIGNGDILVNATEMAKNFDKRVQHFLATEQIKEFSEALTQSRDNSFADLVRVENGDSSVGTWMYEDLALTQSRDNGFADLVRVENGDSSVGTWMYEALASSSRLIRLPTELVKVINGDEICN